MPQTLQAIALLFATLDSKTPLLKTAILVSQYIEEHLLAIFFMARGKSHQYLTHLETLYAKNSILLCKLVPLE